MTAEDEPSEAEGSRVRIEMVSRRSVLGPVLEYYSPRHEGDLPWESGDAYLLSQLGRFSALTLGSFGLLYLLSPVAITGSGDLLRAGSSAIGTLVFALLAIVMALLLLLGALFVAGCRRFLPRSMVLQTDVPWKEMVPEVGKRLKGLGVKAKRKRLRASGLLVGYQFPVRADYAPVKVLGTPVRYVTWGGARSLVVVPLSLFRQPRWGQDLDHLVREVLAWERQEHVVTPATESLDEE